MGGAVVAVGNRYGSVHNIALTGRSEEFVDWYVAAPSAGYQSTDHDVFNAKLDDFQSDPGSANFNAMEGDKALEQEISSLAVTVPSDVLGGGFFLTRTQLTGIKVVAAKPTDAATHGYLEKHGVRITEHGVGFAQYKKPDWFFLKDIIVGITAKLIAAQTVFTREDINFASTDIAFRGDALRAHSAFNLDLGFLKEHGRFSATGLSIRNLMPMTFRYGEGSGKQVVMNPQFRLGWAYQRRDRALAVDLDLSSNPDVALHSRSRYLALGGELGVGNLLFLRGGARFNFLGEQEIAYTAGAGIDLSGHRLDFAGHFSEDQQGWLAHLSIRF